MQNDTSTPAAADLEVEQPNYERIPHWVLFHPEVTSNGVRLYLVLQSFAMGKGTAFPSRRTLAERMNVSIPTVDKARENLMHIGALQEQGRVNERGDQTSNLYTLTWVERNLTGRKESLRPPMQETLRPLESFLDRKTDQEEADEREADTRTPVKKPVDDEHFVAFWSVYPRKVGKGQARRAFAQAVRKTHPRAIIDGAARYRDDPNREAQYTAHPSTWLNGERWLDEPLPARTTRSDEKVSEVQSMIARAAERDRARLEIES